MNSYPFIIITQEMIEEAQRLIPRTQVNRTQASDVDTLTGHLGEFVFAHFMWDNWRLNHVGKNKGQTDFPDFEIKTSAFPFSEKLNLLVREDYAKSRKPKYYVQIIIDTPAYNRSSISAGTKAYICGYASSEEVDNAPKKDFGSKLGAHGGYQCHYISVKSLKPIHHLKT